MPKTRLVAGLLILALLAGPSAARAAGEYAIVASPGVTPTDARTVTQAADRCVPLYAGYLRTRLSAQITIHIYPNREAFVRGRQEATGESPEEAARAANYLGAAIGNAVLINLGMRQDTAELMGTTCHEILHVYQYQLVTEDGRLAHEWMLEGYAYLMEKVALEHLGLGTLAAVRERGVKALKASRALEVRLAGVGGLASGLSGAAIAASTARIFPRLAGMASQEQFEHVGDGFGPGFAYFLIFAMEFLLSRSSHNAFVSYFRSFAPSAGSPSADENFRAAFGMTVTEFQTRLDAHLAAMMR